MLLWTAVYPDQYMDGWKKIHEILLPKKEDFYSHLSMENVTVADYTQAKRVCENLKIRNLGDYPDLYI